MRTRRPRRSCHSIPVTNARMVDKGTGLAADMVFLDMEDSVPVHERGARAQALVQEALQRSYRAATLGVRVNAVDGPWCLDDLTAMVDAPVPPDVVLVPKINDATEVAYVCHLLDALERRRGRSGPPIGVELLIETATAMATVGAIAATAPERVESLVFGPGDFAASIDAPQPTIGALPAPGAPDPQEHALFALVLAGRAHGLQVIDGPYGVLDDPDGLRRSVVRSRSLGCDGKWSIHPSQIPVLNEMFGATEAEIARARQIIDALDGLGAARMGNEMVDVATRGLAEATLRRAGMDAG